MLNSYSYNIKYYYYFFLYSENYIVYIEYIEDSFQNHVFILYRCNYCNYVIKNKFVEIVYEFFR